MPADNAPAAPTFASFYCVECFTGNLPIGQTCARLPRGEFRATCLRCCGHNHG